MENHYTQLNVVEVDPTLYRVECRLTNQVIGYLTRGEMIDRVKPINQLAKPLVISRSLWFVMGQEYQCFNSANEALHALRDYWLTQRIDIQQEQQMRSSDGMLSLVKKKYIKHSNPEFVKRVRTERNRNTMKIWWNRLYGGLIR